MSLAVKLSFQEQVAILDKCIYKGLNLHTELKRLGLTYNDLRYIDNQPITPSLSQYLTPEDFNFAHHGIPVVSFFSGAGGLDIGFEYAGYEHLAAVEINSIF